jgi:hypothetical protein
VRIFVVDVIKFGRFKDEATTQLKNDEIALSCIARKVYSHSHTGAMIDLDGNRLVRGGIPGGQRCIGKVPVTKDVV